MGHHIPIAREQVGIGLLTENVGAQELLHGVFPVGARDNADHVALEEQRGVEDNRQIVVEQRAVHGAHARFALEATHEVLAIRGIGHLPSVINRATVRQGNGGVIELRVVRQLLNAIGADLVNARKRALVHGGQKLDLGLRVGHPLADTPRRLLGGTLEILRVLLGDALVVHGDEQYERGDDYGQRDKNHDNAAVSRFVVCFSHSLCSFQARDPIPRLGLHSLCDLASAARDVKSSRQRAARAR